MYLPMRFWGTSAGGTIPAPFCRCRVCENARKVGGKEIRLRSAFRIDKKIMIDIGEDFAAQAARLNDDLYDTEHFLFTHPHEDHFNYMMFWLRYVASDRPPEKPISVYFVGNSFDIVDKLLYSTPLIINKDAEYMSEKNVKFIKLDFLKWYKINDIEVMALKAHHSTAVCENGANYLIKLKNGKIMYYALDSGYYLDETFEVLKNFKLDILVGECTFPEEHIKDENGRYFCPVHMDLTSCVDTLDKLYTIGTVDEKTQIYLSHIEAKGLCHSELEEYFSKLERNYSVKIAYDGLSIDEDY
ncbi:MBL fold metallo-hydrolase [Qingrenia yutianensis]|uniref:Metallo-beta-lactamase domain-containing protein n=1 Tax=Qingrenia yutianensis TaxID=2763676 RepID=A0A926F7B3_9FIRM|nr:MBL fold metallo-hydrolase [Qingrenia yutianensis]MBC8597138.1 hypothetical protein [Qingrenia yutianensis]